MIASNLVEIKTGTFKYKSTALPLHQTDRSVDRYRRPIKYLQILH
jgi:hypothetical protein